MLVATGPAGALAQSQDQAPTGQAGEEPATVATWQMSVVAGADGWVSPAEPLPVRVTLSSDLLLVGRIDVTIGGATSSQAIEVPAGGVKDYQIQAATPGQRRQLRVNLVSDQGGGETVLETAQVPLRVPADDLVVAVVGADQLETAIRSATPKPMEQDIELVRIAPRDVAMLNSAVSYLVVPGQAMTEIDEADVAAIKLWVEEGGRLIGAASNVSRVADPASGSAFANVPAVALPLGSGEVLAVTDFESLDGADWSELLRSVPQPGIIRVQDDGGQGSLVGAALSGRSASVPALPWLLLGILLFVVLVGPVNFIVLRGFGKPEWAWFTVPLLSAVFVAGFWMVGRSQLQPFSVTHTSVIVENGRGVEGHTAFVLQVESGGTHQLRMAEGWSSEGQNFPGAAPGVVVTDGSGQAVVEYELDDLGVGTAQGGWTADRFGDLSFELQPNGTGFDVVVTNNTDMVFDTWGVVVDGLGWLAADALPAQSESSVAARANSRRNSRYQPVIMEAVERRGFVGDDFYASEYQRIFPMTAYVEQVSPAIKENGIHFFGFTDDSVHRLEINGSSSESTGSALVVVEVPDDLSVLAARTSARPRLLGVDGSSSVEQYYEEIYAYGANSVYLHYAIPPGVTTGEISPGFTTLSVSEVYDWSRGTFVEFEWGEPFNLSSVASPTGEVVVRASRDANDQFFDESLTLARFSLEWS